MRVIFVDDEPRVLEGIARMLSMQGKDWQADYATSAELALTRLEAEPADIVVTDLRMPGGDGVQLLQTVQQRWPATLRVILSGQTEPDEVLRSFRVAHQFIAKPCDSRLLVQSLERISALQRLLQSSDLRALVGRIQHLPAAPRVYTQLTQSLGGESASAGDIASLVSQDPGLAAQVLHLVNSAFFSRGRSVTDIRGAVTRLGTNTLRMLVLTTEVFGSAPHAEELQRRALLASQIVGRMTTSRDECEIAQTAALLADVGLLIRGIDALCAEAATHADARMPLTHVEVGAYLLGIWGLSMPIVEAVAYQANPAAYGAPYSVVGIVHVAVALARGEEPDRKYLETCGVADRLPVWRSVRDELLGT